MSQRGYYELACAIVASAAEDLDIMFNIVLRVKKQCERGRLHLFLQEYWDKKSKELREMLLLTLKRRLKKEEKLEEGEDLENRVRQLIKEKYVSEEGFEDRIRWLIKEKIKHDFFNAYYSPTVHFFKSPWGNFLLDAVGVEELPSVFRSKVDLCERYIKYCRHCMQQKWEEFLKDVIYN